ncbi:MAG: ABC transporter substrate-binding protein, partial [Candidatus Cloacimonadota bacterium]|nr:ABC transporter substrate-binding protein [Candidatus Cloacimonadota bacterium]
IASGKVDIAILPFTYVWKDVEKGLPVKIVSFLERESDGIIARKGISKISDLNGKKIGVLKASTLDIFSEMVEDKYNINMEQIYFRSPMDMAVALTSGEVDALSYYVPSIFKFSDDFKIIYWYGDDWANHPCCDLAANEESIEKKNKQIRKFMKQLEISVNKLNSNLPNGYKTAKEYFSLTKENYYKSAEHQRFNLVLSESGKKFEIETIMQMKKIGYIKGDVQPSKVYEVIQD